MPELFRFGELSLLRLWSTPPLVSSTDPALAECPLAATLSASCICDGAQIGMSAHKLM